MLLKTADVVGLQELAAVRAEVLAVDLASLYPYQLLVPTEFSGKGLLNRFPFVHPATTSAVPRTTGRMLSMCSLVTRSAKR